MIDDPALRRGINDNNHANYEEIGSREQVKRADFQKAQVMVAVPGLLAP